VYLGHLVYLGILARQKNLGHLVSGVPGVAPGSKSSTPPGTLNWSTSTALEVALQVIGALQMMDSQNFTSCHQSKPM